MKLLHIIDGLKLGGTQSLMLRTLQAQQESGVELHLCVLGSNSQHFEWEWLPAGTTYLGLPGDYRRPEQIWNLVRSLRRVITSQQPDLLHSWLWLSDYITALANGKRKLPHVSHIVDRRTWQQSHLWRHRLRRWATRRAFARSGTRFLAVSQAAQAFAIQTLNLDPRRCLVAYNSIDIEPFQDVPPAKFLSPESSGATREMTLGMLGRLVPEKGHPVMLEAMVPLLRAGQNVQLLIAGDGPSLTALQQQSVRLGVAERVQFVGCVPSVKEFLTNVDVLVVPSVDSEGLPTTILEAMAARRLVIASDVGGAAEAVEHQVSGLIVPASDPAGLAAAIRSSMEDRPAVERMVASAYRRVAEDFSMPRMMQTIQAGYELALEERGEEGRVLSR